MVNAAVDEIMNSDEFVMKYFERRYTISEPDELACSGANLAAESGLSVMNKPENEEGDAYD